MTLSRATRHLPFILPLTLILLLALFLRLRGLPGEMPFFGDVGRTYLAGQEIISGHFTLTGPKTSVGNFHLGPLYYYLTAAALFVSGGNAIGPGIMVALGGVLAVVILALYLRKYVGTPAALLGASILAFSPLVVEQSRIPIEPSLVPLFSLLWLWCVSKWWLGESKKWLAASLVIVLLGAQLNFSFVVLGAISCFAFVWKSANLHMKQSLSLLTSAAITLLIFLKILWKGTTGSEYWWSMWLRYSFPANTFVAGMLAALTFMSLMLLIKRRRALPKNVLELMPLWYFWGFFSFCAFLLKTVGGNHALAMVFPLPALILGVALQTHLKKHSQMIIGLFFTGVWLLAGMTTFPRESTLNQAQRVVDAILSEAHGQPYQLIYRGHLDVYEAVDDHWEFLLSQTDNPPQKKGGILYLYSPISAKERFETTGREVIIDDNHLLQMSAE